MVNFLPDKHIVVWEGIAPKPVGQYSPATRAGNLLIVGGNGPLDPETGKVYAEFFPNIENAPTRAVVGVAGLWGDISVETECIALIE